MKKAKYDYGWLSEGVGVYSPEERREKIVELELTKHQIDCDLAEAVALFSQESGDKSIALPKDNRNPYDVDGAPIGTEAFEERTILEKLLIKR